MASFECGVWNETEWNHVWDTGDAAWQMSEADPYLAKHGAEMLKQKPSRVFVPLCGKSFDMVWFYQHGHSVVGVELSDLAVREFFQEQKFSYAVSDVDGVGKCYKSKDGRMTIYVANIFSLSKAHVGDIDFIWDAGSLTAINTEDNPRYVNLLSTFLKEDSQWYVYLLNYDPTVWPGPPHSHSDDEVKRLFGDSFTVEMVHEENMSSEHEQLSNDQTTTEKKPGKVSQKIMDALSKSSYSICRLYKCLPK